jgi:ABC-type molybdate transport system permease subunit
MLSATHTSFHVPGHEDQVVPWPPVDPVVIGLALLVMMGLSQLLAVFLQATDQD